MNGLFLAPYFGKLMMLGFSGFYAWLSGNFAQKAFGMDDAAFSLFGVELWSAWQIWNCYHCIHYRLCRADTNLGRTQGRGRKDSWYCKENQKIRYLVANSANFAQHVSVVRYRQVKGDVYAQIINGSYKQLRSRSLRRRQ